MVLLITISMKSRKKTLALFAAIKHVRRCSSIRITIFNFKNKTKLDENCLMPKIYTRYIRRRVSGYRR